MHKEVHITNTSFVGSFASSIDIAPSDTGIVMDTESGSIALPASLFHYLNLSNDTEISFLFGSYKSAVLFPQTNQTHANFSVESTIISTTVIGYEEDIKGLSEDIIINTTLHDKVGQG